MDPASVLKDPQATSHQSTTIRRTFRATMSTLSTAILFNNSRRGFSTSARTATTQPWDTQEPWGRDQAAVSPRAPRRRCAVEGISSRKAARPTVKVAESTKCKSTARAIPISASTCKACPTKTTSLWLSVARKAAAASRTRTATATTVS